jgi:hypothetical protein
MTKESKFFIPGEIPKTNLTLNDVGGLIGSLLGGLVGMADVDTIREALRWWSESPEALRYLVKMRMVVLEGGNVSIDVTRNGDGAEGKGNN